MQILQTLKILSKLQRDNQKAGIITADNHNLEKVILQHWRKLVPNFVKRI